MFHDNALSGQHPYTLTCCSCDVHRLLNRLLHVGQAAELSNPDCIQNIYQPHGCRIVPSQRSRDVTSETSPKQTSDDLINLSVPHRSHDTTLVAPTPAHELAFP